MVNAIKSTEDLIIEAALDIFHKKGLAGARMQEIANAAGINKAMLHYYYRSKEQLFKHVFLLSYKQFIGGIIPILNNTDTGWEDKISLLLDHYAQNLQQNTDLPLFILNELRVNPHQFISVIQENGISQTVFLQQLKQAIDEGHIRPMQPIQIFISVISGIIFPFLAEPLIKHLVTSYGSNWDTFISERKTIIKEMLIKYLKEF